MTERSNNPSEERDPNQLAREVVEAMQPLKNSLTLLEEALLPDHLAQNGLPRREVSNLIRRFDEFHHILTDLMTCGITGPTHVNPDGRLKN